MLCNKLRLKTTHSGDVLLDADGKGIRIAFADQDISWRFDLQAVGYHAEIGHFLDGGNSLAIRISEEDALTANALLHSKRKAEHAAKWSKASAGLLVILAIAGGATRLFTHSPRHAHTAFHAPVTGSVGSKS